jgi:hypothetical protein
MAASSADTEGATAPSTALGYELSCALHDSGDGSEFSAVHALQAREVGARGYRCDAQRAGGVAVGAARRERARPVLPHAHRGPRGPAHAAHGGRMRRGGGARGRPPRAGRAGGGGGGGGGGGLTPRGGAAARAPATGARSPRALGAALRAAFNPPPPRPRPPRSP